MDNIYWFVSTSHRIVCWYINIPYQWLVGTPVRTGKVNHAKNDILFCLIALSLVVMSSRYGAIISLMLYMLLISFFFLTLVNLFF